MKKQPKRKGQQAWAVIANSKIIGWEMNGGPLKIFPTKIAAQTQTFAGRHVVRCEVTYSLPKKSIKKRT